MTRPNVSSDWLIVNPSSRRSPMELTDATLSLPARSMKLMRLCRRISCDCPSTFSSWPAKKMNKKKMINSISFNKRWMYTLWANVMVKIACERELLSLDEVAAVALWRLPTSSQRWISSKELTAWCDKSTTYGPWRRNQELDVDEKEKSSARIYYVLRMFSYP